LAAIRSIYPKLESSDFILFGTPICCGPLMEMFRMSFDYLGMELTGSLLAVAYERGEIEERPEELKRAYDLGRSL